MRIGRIRRVFCRGVAVSASKVYLFCEILGDVEQRDPSRAGGGG